MGAPRSVSDAVLAVPGSVTTACAYQSRSAGALKSISGGNFT